MEDSPKLLSKRSKRLSLKKPSKNSDSPKTPCRVAASSSAFSTPLNSYKRSSYAEESPSQDYDSDSALICTQEARKNHVDVEWKWEEQSPNVVKSKITKPIRVENLRKTSRPFKQIPKKSILRLSPDMDQNKGFYKFKEELFRDLKDGSVGSSNNRCDHDESLLNDFELNELDSSLKENVEHDISDMKEMYFGLDIREVAKERSDVTSRKTDAQNVKRANSGINFSGNVNLEYNEASNQQSVQTKISTNQPPNSVTCEKPKTNESVDIQHNVLEDTDSDDLLLLCSQQVEASYHNQIKRKKIEKQDFLFANDSQDDIFLSVPVEYPASIPSTSCRSPLVRHNSMPARSPIAKPRVQRPSANNFLRHNSMPTADQKPIASKISSEVISISSSTESINSEKRRCTAAEIERKRLEAIQRRQASKVRQLSGSSTTGSQLNTNKVKR